MMTEMKNKNCLQKMIENHVNYRNRTQKNWEASKLKFEVIKKMIKKSCYGAG